MSPPSWSRSAAPPPIEQIEVDEAVTRVADGAVLLDVRSDEERAGGHAPGSQFIALHELESRWTELDPAIPIIAICRVGGRSQAAAEFLAAQGLTVANLTGGMLAWEAAGRRVIDETGAPGVVL